MGRSDFADKLIDTLENAVRGRQVLVIGSQYSGKTEFLKIVKKQLSIRQRNWVAFQAGKAGDLFTPQFFDNLLSFLKTEGYIKKDVFFENRSASLVVFFRKLDSALYKESIRHLVIIADDLDEDKLSLDQISTLLSTIRGFYTEWNDIEINIHFIFAGKLNTHLLLNMYRGADSASWPLLRNKTVFNLPLLTIGEIKSAITVRNSEFNRSLDLHANYLFELTNGDRFTLGCLLNKLENKKNSCQSFYDATEALVRDINWVTSIEVFTKKLSVEANHVLVRNLCGQSVILPDRELKEELLLSGLFKLTPEGGIHILNSVIERTLRENGGKFFPIKNERIFKDVKELIPPIFILNKKAFELVSEIEMRLRNLAAVRLGVQSNNPQKHFLSGLNYEKNPHTEQNEDQYFRSNDWRRKVSKSRFVDTHAALISFTDTKDLLGLVDYLISKNDEIVSPLKNMRSQLSGLKDIRDAVMHGQVITEQTVDNLIDINLELNKALAVVID